MIPRGDFIGLDLSDEIEELIANCDQHNILGLHCSMRP